MGVRYRDKLGADHEARVLVGLTLRIARILSPTPRAAFLASLIALTLVPAAGARAEQVGAVADISWIQSRAAVDREVAMLRFASVQWVRANINWAYLEPKKGRIDRGVLAQYDYAIGRVRAAGISVLMPISDGVPYWASADPRKHRARGRQVWNQQYRPRRMRDYGRIVGFAVRHFARQGVRAYEIWNEPNLTRFWPPGPSPSSYVSMLRAAYKAAKAASRRVTVLIGGLSRSDYPYLEAVYRAGGRPFFDAVAVHPYTYGVPPQASFNGPGSGRARARISQNAFPAIKEIHRTMASHGDARRKKIWLTEFGYSSYHGPGGVSEQQQAAYLSTAYRYVQAFPWVHSLFWYQARNNPFLGDSDTFEGRFGLLTSAFVPKPSYVALKSYADAVANRRPPPPAPQPPPPAPQPPPHPMAPAPPSQGQRPPPPQQGPVPTPPPLPIPGIPPLPRGAPG